MRRSLRTITETRISIKYIFKPNTEGVIKIFAVIKLRHAALAALCCGAILLGVLLHKSLAATSGDNLTEGVYVPIFMYHSVLKNADPGEKYIVSLNNLESDIKYLKENGYTTVLFTDLINYVKNGAELPQNPVMLTFDDGFYNNYAYMLPLLEKYDSKAIISIVGDYTDMAAATADKNPAYAYLDWEDCRALLKSGRIELQNHSYSMHNLKGNRRGCKKLSGESEEEYHRIFENDIEKLQTKMHDELGITPNLFTYPFGLISDASLSAVKDMGFEGSLSCSEGVSFVTRDPQCLYQLKRCNRVNSKSAQQILTELRKSMN